MTCDRCGGLQLWSRFSNLIGAWAYDGWRCMNCGNITDAVILENRRRQHGTVSTVHRARPYEGHVIWLRLDGKEAPADRAGEILTRRRRQPDEMRKARGHQLSRRSGPAAA